MNFLAFDLGASGGKLFLARLDRGKLALEEIHRFANGPIRMGDGLYWDFIRIYAQLTEGLQKAVRMTGDAIEALALDSFSNDFGIVDKNGELISPVRCYRDPRTARHAAELDAIMPPDQRYRLSGNQNALFNTLMHIGAMRANGQDWMLENGTLLWVPDLLNYFMTGVKGAEYTIASVSQMYSFAGKGWSSGITGAYGIPPALLPTIHAPGTVLGDTSPGFNKQTGSNGFRILAACEHDTASAFLSSIAPSGSAIISSGTWALVGVETAAPIITDDSFRLNFANEGGYPGRHRFLRNAMGSWLIQELRREWAAEERDYSYSELDELAERAEPFRFHFDVDEEQFFSPGDMRNKIVAACARHSGGARPETPGEFVRAVQENLALRYRWIIEKLEQLTGDAIAAINVVGGGSRSRMMCQFIAGACGRTVFAGPEEATALGNIAVQMAAVGAVDSIDQAKAIIAAAFPPRMYEPAERAEWNSAFVKWTEIAGANQ